jgi:hypothetical protein
MTCQAIRSPTKAATARSRCATEILAPAVHVQDELVVLDPPRVRRVHFVAAVVAAVLGELCGRQRCGVSADERDALGSGADDQPRGCGAVTLEAQFGCWARAATLRASESGPLKRAFRRPIDTRSAAMMPSAVACDQVGHGDVRGKPRPPLDVSGFSLQTCGRFPYGTGSDGSILWNRPDRLKPHPRKDHVRAADFKA